MVEDHVSNVIFAVQFCLLDNLCVHSVNKISNFCSNKNSPGMDISLKNIFFRSEFINFLWHLFVLGHYLHLRNFAFAYAIKLRFLQAFSQPFHGCRLTRFSVLYFFENEIEMRHRRHQNTTSRRRCECDSLKDFLKVSPLSIIQEAKTILKMDKCIKSEHNQCSVTTPTCMWIRRGGGRRQSVNFSTLFHSVQPSFDAIIWNLDMLQNQR